MENLFEKGCLVQLSASVWQASRRIKPNQLNSLAASSAWLKASKKLVDPEAIKPIQKIVNAARTYLTGVSLPFPIQGMVFAPKEMISKLDQELEEFRGNFNTEVERFMGCYESLREAAIEHLGELFNDLDYPLDLKAKFSFAWRFVILDVPNGNTAILAPEVYEREKKKFVQTMEEARELAVRSLREEFAGLIERITDRFATGLDGKPKVFKNTTVRSFYEFFETFTQRNIFRDRDLEELVGRAKAILGGVSAETVRSDIELKEQIKNGMNEVEHAMAEIFSRPRRKIMLN